MSEPARRHRLVPILAALGANVGVAAIKLVAWGFTGSSAMLAESVHSVVDSMNEVLLLVGGRQARQPNSRQHPFGHGRYRYLYSFLVAIVIFLGGGVFAIFQAVEKLQAPRPIEDPWWAIAVLLVALVLEGLSLRTAVRSSAKARGEASLWRYFWKAKTPELLVVLIEDIGALIGLALALVGISAAIVTGDGVWDALGTLCIGTLLVLISFVLASRIRSLLLGESASADVVISVRGALVDGLVLQRLIHVRTLHLGPDEILVAAKVAIPAEATGAAIAAAINAAEARVRALVSERCVIYIEPDIDRSQGPAHAALASGAPSDSL